jgi:hypothetical protein
VHVFFIDHRNDIVVNAFGLAMSIVGTRVAWYADPIGAILIGVRNTSDILVRPTLTSYQGFDTSFMGRQRIRPCLAARWQVGAPGIHLQIDLLGRDSRYTNHQGRYSMCLTISANGLGKANAL